MLPAVAIPVSHILDSFQYVRQMGRLAKLGVKAIFHNIPNSSE